MEKMYDDVEVKKVKHLPRQSLLKKGDAKSI